MAMRAAGRLAAETLDFLTPHVVTGVTTAALDRLCHDYIVAHGATPAPLNYRGFPKSICTSINHVVCHGIPGDRKLVDSDTLNIDITVVLNGWHGDTSRMYVTGTPSTRASRLIDVTYEALMRGVEVVKPGATLGDIGMRSRYSSRRRGSRWCEIFVVTGSAAGSTRRRTCCISADPEMDRCSSPACSSPSNPWSTPAAPR